MRLSSKLRNQTEQISRQLAKEPQGTLPGDTIVNLKKQCNTITSNGGESYKSPRMEDKFKVDEEAP